MRPQDRILDAALRVFRRHGFRRSSIEQAAEAAGLTRQALYHHFQSKEAPFRAVIVQLYDGANAGCRRGRAGGTESGEARQGEEIQAQKTWQIACQKTWRSQMSTMTINGRIENLPDDPEALLIEVVRDALDLTGTKLVCGA